MTSLLLVEDESAGRSALAIALRRAGFIVEESPSLAEARHRLETRSFDAVVADYQLGDGTGMDLLHGLRARGIPSSFVMITAYGTIPLAVRAMRDGASHFLAKPFEPDALVGTLREILAREGQTPAGRHAAPRIVARSTAMRQVLERAREVATARSPVLITGRTGAGKEVVARYVHDCGPRRDRPFVAINCAAVAPNLFESEFFGHSRGAFTNATDERPGVFREADGGTLLLDEIAEIPLELQAKLLRTVETGEFRRVGGSGPDRADVRIIATTNLDPIQAVRDGRVREDLYYRLSASHIAVPPLAERPEDVSALAERFLEELADVYAKPIDGFTPEAIEQLERRAWPGNVRELRHAVERAVISCRGSRLEANDLPPSPGPLAPAGAPDLKSAEREHILRVLGDCGGNKAKAARLLGISKSTLRRKLMEYGLHEPV